MKKNAALVARREAAVPRGVGSAHPIFAARAENAESHQTNNIGVGVNSPGDKNSGNAV